MRKTIFLTLIVLTSVVLLQGCIALVAAGIAGGAVYTTSDDSSEVSFERSWDVVFDACVHELGMQGNVGLQDRGAGTLQGFVEGAKVEMKLEKPTENSVKLTVEARKHEGVSPAPEIAEKLTFAITKRLG